MLPQNKPTGILFDEGQVLPATLARHLGPRTPA